MVVSEGYRVFLCDTVTGLITADVPVSKLSWGVRLDNPGAVQATLPIMARELRNLDVRNATTALRQSLGVAYGGRILECGPIWEQDYDAEKEELGLTAAGLWSIFDSRKALPGNAPGSALSTSSSKPAAASLTFSNLSLGSIARELVRVSIQDNPFTRADGLNAGALNVVLPPKVSGTHTRTYFGYDLGWVGARLHELTEVQGGPDIRFRPQFMASDPTRVEWVLETGTDDYPLLNQTGPDWAWDASVERSGVAKLGVKRSAKGMGFRAWTPGNGQERDMKIAWSTDPTLAKLGFPWVETDSASKQVEDPVVLQSASDRLLADSRYPWDTWSLSVRADTEPMLGRYLPGDWATVTVGKGHPMISAGDYSVRIMAVDGDESEVVKLTVAPIQGSV
jgi:hypothetical protein